MEGIESTQQTLERVVTEIIEIRDSMQVLRELGTYSLFLNRNTSKLCISNRFNSSISFFLFHL